MSRFRPYVGMWRISAQKRYRHQPRNHSILVEQIWSAICSQNPAQSSEPDAHIFKPTVVSGRWLNNRAENSHQPFRRRERAMISFRRMRTLQKFVAVHASIHNHFNQDRILAQRDYFKANRTAALNEWRGLCPA